MSSQLPKWKHFLPEKVRLNTTSPIEIRLVIPFDQDIIDQFITSPQSLSCTTYNMPYKSLCLPFLQLECHYLDLRHLHLQWMTPHKQSEKI